MITIVPTPAQYALLCSHPCGYDYAVKLVSGYITSKGLDVDAGFERILKNIEQQNRFNATAPVRLSQTQHYAAQEYRMMRG